jgi:uncharacterized protein (TIGR02118 family)
VYKCVWLIKFRPELDPEEVRRAWRTSHGALALQVPGIRRYIQNHWIQASTGSEMTYDGSVDCWFDNREAFEKAWASPEWKALLDDDVRLFDRERVPAFEGAAVNEHIMRWEGLPEGRIYTSAGTIPEPASSPD